MDTTLFTCEYLVPTSMHPTYLVETHELVGSVVVSGVEGGAVERNRTVKDESGKELPV